MVKFRYASWQLNLLPEADAVELQLMNETAVIDRFEQTWSKHAVHGDGVSDDGLNE